MDQVIFMQYQPGGSCVHTLSPEIKFFLLFLLMTLCIILGWKGYLLLSMFLVGIYISAKISLHKVVKQLHFFIVMILLVIITKISTTSGTPFFEEFPSFTIEGAIDGLFFGWRIFLIIFISNLYTTTTTISNTNKVLYYVFKPTIFNENRIALMVSLTLNMIPILFNEANNILLAQKARCVEQQKNLIKRLKYIVIPVFVQAFLKANDIALALEARCYNDLRNVEPVNIKKKDWLFLLLVSFIIIIIIIADRL